MKNWNILKFKLLLRKYLSNIVFYFKNWKMDCHKKNSRNVRISKFCINGLVSVIYCWSPVNGWVLEIKLLFHYNLVWLCSIISLDDIFRAFHIGLFFLILLCCKEIVFWSQFAFVRITDKKIPINLAVFYCAPLNSFLAHWQLSHYYLEILASYLQAAWKCLQWIIRKYISVL